MKNNSEIMTGRAITADIIERLSESYYLVKDRYDKSTNEDSLTLISLPPRLDIQVGETVTVNGNYLISEDISFIDSLSIIHLNRCNDALSELYVKEISELSRGMRDYDFVIQVSKNETNVDDNVVRYIDGYKWKMSLKKQTIMCISPPADLSPNTFLCAQSSQRLFFNKNIPSTSERLRWNAACMIAKAIIPSKKTSKDDYDKIATWLIMRDKRYSLDHNRKLIDFIEGCRSFESICGSKSNISLVMKEIKDKFISEIYNGSQNEMIDVLGLKENKKRPSKLIKKCCHSYTELRDNIVTPSQTKENIITITYEAFRYRDEKESTAIQLYYFMNSAISYDSEDIDIQESYKKIYYRRKNEYNIFCLKHNIQAISPLDGVCMNRNFLEMTKNANRKASCVYFLKRNKHRLLQKNRHEKKLVTTLYSNKKWNIMPIQRQNILNSMTNNELVNVLISQSKYLHGLINEFVEKQNFSLNDREVIRKEIINLGALIAETQFGVDKETNKNREYYFHFRSRHFREDYIALLRSIKFFDNIFNINSMMSFFNQLIHVLESIFLQDNYPEYKKISIDNIINDNGEYYCPL